MALAIYIHVLDVYSRYQIPLLEVEHYNFTPYSSLTASRFFLKDKKFEIEEAS